MTSKRLFCKVMRQELRHEAWMAAISILVSFLCFPVAWLLYKTSSLGGYVGGEEIARLLTGEVVSFLSTYPRAMGGLLAVGGGVLAALGGFRFLFHRNQTDSWHSMPVKRRTIYWSCWLDGLLIWMIPIGVGMLLQGIMAGSFLKSRGDWWEAGWLAGQLAGTFFLTLLVFLLTYHLTLIAIMISGNLLNALVSLMILGFGGVAVYGLCLLMAEFYLKSVYLSVDWSLASYLSPLFGTLALYLGGLEETPGSFALWTLIAAALGAAARVLYQRRPSELAEQGIGSRPLSAIFRSWVTLVAGLSGWLICSAITGDGSLLWGIFGGCLLGILAFGLLDITFRMDFKAFFAHKLQMAVTLAAVLVIGIFFANDVFGYDTYLPEKEQIASVGLYCDSFSNGYYSEEIAKTSLAEMEFTDKEAAYAFLERAAGRTTELGRGGWGRYSVLIRVTLENGKSYYRRYGLWEEDVDVILPLVTSREYVQSVYFLNLLVEEPDRVVSVELGRADKGTIGAAMTEEQVAALVKAYNQDVLAQPERIVTRDGRAFLRVSMRSFGPAGIRDSELVILDFMENTLRALEEIGYGEYTADVDSSRVEEIILFLPETEAAEPETAETEGAQAEAAQTETAQAEAAERTLRITDRAEIEELLALVDYDEGWFASWERQRGNIISLQIIEKTGEEWSAGIRKDMLPQKYR